MDETLPVVVIGAGQAGLTVSYLLTKAGVEHTVLERGAVGESWRSQRWNSFCLNTPNWANSLPGLDFSEENPDAFANREELVSYLERYVERFHLPVRQHTPVTRLTALQPGHYHVHTPTGTILARAVVLASGSMSRPRLPEMATDLPSDIVSIPAASYRRAQDLPDGAVLVVGSGQSGCQIAEDLIRSGRKVLLSASHVGRAPRTYRGRDIITWLRDLGLLDTRGDELEDPSARFEAQPQVSGTDGGHTVSLQSLARDGVTLLGRVIGVRGDNLTLGADLLESIAFADEKSTFFKTVIDKWIDGQGITAEPPREDPGEPPLPDLGGSERIRELDLQAEGVCCVIWCTGFHADWSWVDVEVFDGEGRPRHRDGITDRQGLYFIGHPWLSKRKSGLLYGVAEDAERVVTHLLQGLRQTPAT
jgi:putative flavoprotein involved in K+ transport